jgi:hypothetical protein
VRPHQCHVLRRQLFEGSTILAVESRQVDVVLVHRHQSQEHNLAVDGVGSMGRLLLLRLVDAGIRRFARKFSPFVQQTLNWLEKIVSENDLKILCPT